VTTVSGDSGQRRIGLIGCVKQKANGPKAAKDLYTSTLFIGRRRYVESNCDEWWILSAAHGLVHPADELEPYDVALNDAGRMERRNWSTRVLASIDERVHPEPGNVFEIHAGAEYRDFGLLDGVRSRGCCIEIPTEGMRIGHQLRFYKDAAGS
jgi:hypothetical protein